MSGISQHQYQRIVEAIYDAPLHGDWQSVVEVLSATMGGIHTHMLGHDLSTGRHITTNAQMYDPEMIASYDAHYQNLNSWLPGVARSEVGKATPSESYCSTEYLIRTEFYNDWVRPQEDIGAGGGIVLFNDGCRFVIVGGNIRFRDREDKERRWITLLDTIGPHLRRAFQAWRAFAQTRQEAGGYCDALEQVGYAAVLLDRHGRVVDQNKAADELFVGAGPFHLDAFSSFRTCDRRANSIIEQGLAGMAAHGAEAAPDAFPIRSLDQGGCHSAMLMPFPRRYSADTLAESLLDGDWPIAVLVVKKPIERPQKVEMALTLAFNLTATEAALADALAQGYTLRRWAERRCVSIHTVRNQLQAIFAKTGTTRQADLVRTVERLRAR